MSLLNCDANLKYFGGNGSHVKLILDELKVVMRDHNLGKILE